jgi:hypothetical protein
MSASIPVCFQTPQGHILEGSLRATRDLHLQFDLAPNQARGILHSIQHLLPEYFVAPIASVEEIGLWTKDHTNEKKSDYDQEKNVVVYIRLKDLRTWRFFVPVPAALNRRRFCATQANKVASWLQQLSFTHNPLQKFSMGRGGGDVGWGLFDQRKEWERQGVLPNGQSPWRECNLNQNYTLCPTYPSLLIMPAAITDHTVQEASSYRTKGRLPMLSWCHPQHGATLWRSSQPMVGFGQNHSHSDEVLLRAIVQPNVIRPKLTVVDCRPRVNAEANRFKGGGVESARLHKGADSFIESVAFMEIANIHAVRKSFRKLRSLVESQSTDDFRWHSLVEDTKWLLHIRCILSAALRCATAMHCRATTILCHCSDGWDRTSQVCTALILHSYCTHTALILHSYCTHTALILHSYCTPTALILHSYCTPTALILHSYCTHTVRILHSNCRCAL